VVEMAVYQEDYPQVVAIELCLKTIICTFLLLFEAWFILKKKLFNFCKVTYALKLILIIIAFY